MNMGEQETLITVALPEVTRATNSAEGAFANVDLSGDATIRYILKIYQKVGDEYKASTDRQVEYSDSESVVFPVRLVPNRDYRFVVWADYVESKNDTDFHYNTHNDGELANITLKDTWVAMDETRDAFTGYFDTADGDKRYSAGLPINITLKRPFAKLRVITTDMKELGYLDIEPDNAVVTYTTQFHESFNAFNGQYGDETVSKTHISFTIKEYDDNKANESKVLFTDYFFADDSDVVKFVMNVNEANGALIKSNTFNTDIAVRRNYLTTIQGNILTDGNNVKVTIEDTFANYDENDNLTDPNYEYATISSDVELLAAIAKLQEPGANCKFIITAPLTVDYSLISTLAATRAASATLGSVTINLNGFTVTFVSNGDEPVITLPAGSELTLVNDSNEGGIIVTGEGTGAAIENNGLLNIEDVALQSESNGAVIENNNVANIEGSTLNDGALVNNENGQANIEGSTLNEGSVENNGQVDFTDSTLYEGSVENNGQANVNGGNVDDNAVENGEGAVVGSQSAEDLQRAINNAKAGEPNVFTLTADIEGDVVVVIQKPDVKITIDGDADHKYKFNGYFKVHSNSNHYDTAAVTFKNIKFETSTASVNFIEALENGAERYSTNITIEGCTFTATGDAVNTAVGASVKATRNFVMNGCEGKNLHSLLQANSCDVDCPLVIKNCKAIDCKGGISFTQVLSSVVENVEIDALGYGIRYDGRVDNYGITVKNCDITAAQPFIVRKMTGKNNTIALEGENTLTSTREAYQIVITNDSDDAAYAAPTGTYTLTGADNFILYPRDVVSSWAEFTAALAANKTSFLLAEDITYDANYQLQKDVIIDLNGKSMTLPMINIHNKVTIKNGTINGKVYARKNSEIVFDNVKFSGAVADNLSTEGHLAIQGGCRSLYAKDCLFSPTSVSGSQTKPLSFEGGSSILKFENCEFKSSPYKKQVYLNSLSATGSIEFINCNFNNKTPNIMFAAACPLTNLTMSGTTKLSSVTLETNRAQDAVTAEDLAYLRESLIANNSMSSVRLFYAGGSSEYIR